ncbi:MAG: response regulator transcription factor [Syntrophomonadaceae bacterium]|nr:response regulator transcription factor [Syntrophomonadaceae bacterium]
MNETILLVEDDKKMQELILDYFESEGFNILSANNGEIALDIIKSKKIDLLILDIMLPRIDGWTVCRTVRAVSNIPIIILTARAQEEDRLLGFELGADDYVTKPFSPRELVARAKVLLKRSSQNHDSTDVLQIGTMKIERFSHEVTINDSPIYLSPKEYELLLYLINNIGIVLSREQLLQGVWGYSHYGNLRTVDTHVNRLRDKLGNYASYIQTIRGFGYKFNDI